MSEEIDEVLLDAVAYAISEANDIDVTWEMYARAAITAYRKTEATLLSEVEKTLPNAVEAIRQTTKIGNSPADAAEREVARLTRLLEDTRYELTARNEAERQLKLKLIDLALDWAKSTDPTLWEAAEQMREVLDVAGHPDGVKAANA